MKTYIGSIMWISDRDGNGIILVQDKIEVYFDSSVFPEFKNAKRKDVVTFNRNAEIPHMNCARDIELVK